MAYTINLTNGTVFATIADGTVNTNSSMTLIGKNYAGYGQFLDDNFIHLLENSSNTTAPASPLTGQLWWDSTNTLLKIYTGTAWKPLAASTSSSSQPSNNITGDLWYDTTNQQLKVYTGAAYLVVGPAYTSSQGTSGAIPLSVTDNGGTPHIVTGLYANGTLVSIVSPDTDFIPNATYSTLFPKIFKGTTVWNTGATGGNIAASGNVSVTAAGSATLLVTSTGANVAGYANITGNITGGNITTAGLVTVTGNVTGGNINTGGVVSATGNINGGNVNGGANVNAITHTGTTVSVTGNVTGGNLVTGGLVTVTGNVTGGNVNTGGLISATGNITGGNVNTGGIISATGNISSAGNVSGSFFLGNGSQLTGLSSAVSVTKIVNGTSEANVGSSGGNIAFTISGTSNVMVVATTGIVVSNISVTNNITTTGNATGNIGSAANPFNIVYAKSTSAQYADVAERFEADELLAPGTVVELGGAKEITRAKMELSETVFGVISTLPAYVMNGAAGEDDTHPKVAMTGRVPVKVTGVVHKGDRLVSAGSGIARAAQPGEATAFNVIGRALVDKLTPESGTIEAIVTIK